MTRCDDTCQLLGSYALGGLEAGETREVERHLETCADCRLAYAQLAPLPALLDLVSPSTPAHATPSPRLEGSVLAGFAAQRNLETNRAPRRRRWPSSRGRGWWIALPSGLAGATACMAVLAVTGDLPSPTAGDSRVALASATGVGDAFGTATLAATDAGTEVELKAKLPSLRPGEVYELWFVRGEGRVSAGTFTVDTDGRADLRLATAARAESYDRLGITREPDGLDPARNGPSVVVGPLRS